MGGLFRGVRAPASLKRRGLAGRAADPPTLPGRTRPGLIEAPTGPSRHPRPCSRLFRGVRAPASLKPRLRGIRGRIPPGTLPGRTRPGLIEAGTDGRPPSGPTSSLPGRTRPGLIEARRSGTATGSRCPLPGRTRPGLIEARSGSRTHSRPPWPLPGRTRPGLIEASFGFPQLGGRVELASSGADLPRGLIEAQNKSRDLGKRAAHPPGETSPCSRAIAAQVRWTNRGDAGLKAGGPSNRAVRLSRTRSRSHSSSRTTPAVSPGGRGSPPRLPPRMPLRERPPVMTRAAL